MTIHEIRNRIARQALSAGEHLNKAQDDKTRAFYSGTAHGLELALARTWKGGTRGMAERYIDELARRS